MSSIYASVKIIKESDYSTLATLSICSVLVALMKTESSATREATSSDLSHTSPFSSMELRNDWLF